MFAVVHAISPESRTLFPYLLTVWTSMMVGVLIAAVKPALLLVPALGGLWAIAVFSGSWDTRRLHYMLWTRHHATMADENKWLLAAFDPWQIRNLAPASVRPGLFAFVLEKEGWSANTIKSLTVAAFEKAGRTTPPQTLRQWNRLVRLSAWLDLCGTTERVTGMVAMGVTSLTEATDLVASPEWDWSAVDLLAALVDDRPL